ncbi:MAG: type II secretion system major pseudopilin GspG [Candidatus Dadabacteria bacterium]|nr:type II secretion system major pseudopilin GspG [Candidatus Dadabacteria bacterium]
MVLNRHLYAVNSARRSEAGITLIEIMVVLVIISSIAFLVAPKVIERLGEAKRTTTKVQIKSLENALKLFKLHNGFYPETQQGLQALVELPAVGRAVNLNKYPPEGYLEGDAVPLDAWGGEFVYIGPDQSQYGRYEIISLGEDGQPSDDDISNRDPQ